MKKLKKKLEMGKALKTTIWLFWLFVIATIIHNAIYGILGIEEAVFFILALLFALAFVVSLACTAVLFVIKLARKELNIKKKKAEKTMLMMLYAALLMVAGIMLNIFGIGRGKFEVFGSVGNWLIYTGFAGLIIATLLSLVKAKRVVDERMLHIASKAGRVTFIALLIAAFAIIVADGIKPITMPYHLFMSYLVSFMLVVYWLSYKVMLRMN